MADQIRSIARTRTWYFRGLRAAFSLPALILASAHVGFAGLAKEFGFSLAETMFMIGFVWALPANVVLVGAVASGATLWGAAFAVALSSVRLMPMVVSLIPELRAKQTRKWVLYLLSHCVAVTSWVIAMERIRKVPLDMRTAYYAGLGPTLVIVNTLLTGMVYVLVERLPPSIMAGLLFLTPIYFLISLWGSARERAGKVAMVLGVGLGPAFHVVVPQFDLLAAGLSGGFGAFLFHLFHKARQRQAA
ncbi:AzlC family ABC transporter permease [Pseudaminobacter sp. 19-2017]|uniref:AzlC family ABC transporter permease n=2 Tax=Pseudaminobacter soli (ex Zhang et al. 2022) TaxID=2831468 RepID=A0A942DYY8_9HYPH|nr:AzlC family ABC transporter permease [Pseudaminobacter soli]MBS3647505.1 AzlC family ABC transporter permease [Pseudaminobacter soli]